MAGLAGEGPQPRAPSTAIGARMGLLPQGTQSGFPAPLTLDGSVCLELPLQYNFTASPRQRGAIPAVYGLMHAALLCLALMPLPLCHALWTALVGRAPWLRRWYALPVDDFEYVHRLLGSLCIGLIALGATIWLATMVPLCMADASSNACLAFARGGLDGAQFDPFRNVLVLRLIVAPLWGTVLPLMAFAGTTWQEFVQGQQQQVGLARHIRHCMRHPVACWLWLVGAASGLAVGTWAGGGVGAAVGGSIGAVCGAWLASLSAIKLHWYEFCYWSHRAVAYLTVLVALIARFDVFWPCAATWLAFALDKWAQRRSSRRMYIDTRESRCIMDPQGKPSKLRLVLVVRADTYERRAASKWVQLSVPNMLSGASSRTARAVAAAWHPLSLASHSDTKIELLIDVHPRLCGKPSWSEQVFAHVARLQERAVTVSATDAHYPPQLAVQVRGPFGSAFARCFESKRRVGQADAPLHDLVVLLGSGIGLPSALSALHEFVERRRAGKAVPRFVWFVWQCRATEELQLCWDALHRIVYGGHGLCDEAAHRQARAALTRGGKVPLDRAKHMQRHGGQPWDEGSPMLEWLGVTLHVSSWGRDAALERTGRAALAADDPLHDAAGDPAAARVHAWLCGRLRAGHHDLGALLGELDALDREYTPHQTEPRRLCVSLCGSQRAMLRARAQMAAARGRLRGDAAVSYELAADYHG